MKVNYGTTEERVKNAIRWYAEKKTEDKTQNVKLQEHVANECELSDQEYELYLQAIESLLSGQV
jgi:hypothetical protein